MFTVSYRVLSEPNVFRTRQTCPVRNRQHQACIMGEIAANERDEVLFNDPEFLRVVIIVEE